MIDNFTAKWLGGCLLHSSGRAVGVDRCLPALLAGRLDVVYVREQAPLTFYILPLSASDIEATLFFSWSYCKQLRKRQAVAMRPRQSTETNTLRIRRTIVNKCCMTRIDCSTLTFKHFLKPTEISAM